VKTCNIICLIVIILFQLQEFIQMFNTRASQYWSYWRNTLAHVYFIVYYYYFVDRFVNSHDPLLALELKATEKDTPKIDLAVNDAFLNFYLVAYAMITALELVKVQDNIGQISKVAEGVLGEVATLFIFMLGWVIAFSMLHRVIGNNVDPTQKLDKDTGSAKLETGKYPYLDNDFTKYFLHTWAMSTGGGQNPNYSVWFQFQKRVEGGEGKGPNGTDQFEDRSDRPGALLMVFLTWLTHLVNQLFVKTILLSFLIAIVKGSYDKLMKQEVKLSYASKAIMNNKTSNFLKTFGLLSETDMISISADYEVAAPKSNQGQMKKEVATIEQKITKVNDQMKNLVQK
jgi:hypothetical protein